MKSSLSKVGLLFLLFGCAALLSALPLRASFAACLDEIKDRGILIVGTTGRFPPFTGITAAGELEGYDIDWLNGIAEKLGVKADFIAVEGAGLFPGLLAKKFDTVSASFVITEERLKAVNFPEPYSASGTIMLVRADDEEFRSYMDLEGRSIGVILGSVDERRLRDKVPGWKELKTYPGWSEQWADLLAGRVDGLSTDYHVANRSMANEREADKVRIAGEAVFKSVSGFPVRKECTGLLAAMTEAIRELKAEGLTQKASRTWFGSELTPEFIESAWAEVNYIGKH